MSIIADPINSVPTFLVDDGGRDLVIEVRVASVAVRAGQFDARGVDDSSSIFDDLGPDSSIRGGQC